ncbi:MAG: outer membrane lipoprotein carrier protein LolA, partial [Novosphingobium sp.]|nr:outer membrane lipoprotein carrier protein LolA [Novosphingobium sp.]
MTPMKSLIKFAALPAFVLGSLAVPAAVLLDRAEAQPADSALDQAVSALRGISTLKADFTQSDRNGQVVSGKLTLKRPGRIRFEYDKSVNMLIVADGNSLNVIDYDVRQVQRWPIKNSPL